MRHKPTVFENKPSVIYFFAVLWSLPYIQMYHRNVYHECWLRYENVTENSYQIGFFDGMPYQLVFLIERQYIELQCRGW